MTEFSFLGELSIKKKFYIDLEIQCDKIIYYDKNI